MLDIGIGDMGDEGNFYSRLPATGDFASLADARNHYPLPDDWIVVVTDIESSRKRIDSGGYKVVNLVGASAIAAFMNLVSDEAFPFVFGGDGASLALPGRYAADARKVLADLRRWAGDEFGLTLRAGVMSVAEIRKAGFDVCTARYAASESVSYAAFSGRGVRWLEKRVKSGDTLVEMAAPGATPDLTGLSCRWSNLSSQRGTILSLVIEPAADAAEETFLETTRALLARIDDKSGGEKLVPPRGPGVEYPPPGMTIEARATRAGGSFMLRYLALCAQNLLAWTLFRTGWSIAGFDPRHYARQTGLNTDSRKFEDGLKMTLDCDAETLNWVKEFLAKAKQGGKIRYGLTEQSEAFLTCIVMSALDDNHVHFVDGANGGYAAATTMMQD
ncbi:DUF3095 domain-containing protein [Primorskyibacter sp. S87]|uniref:DUF3095 domain-containing protein n=1 Tax=Primorskyibacter sp. S87 TaxID=3415126 RepID=UPI003C79C8B2